MLIPRIPLVATHAVKSWAIDLEKSPSGMTFLYAARQQELRWRAPQNLLRCRMCAGAVVSLRQLAGMLLIIMNSTTTIRKFSENLSTISISASSI